MKAFSLKIFALSVVGIIIGIILCLWFNQSSENKAIETIVLKAKHIIGAAKKDYEGSDVALKAYQTAIQELEQHKNEKAAWGVIELTQTLHSTHHKMYMVAGRHRCEKTLEKLRPYSIPPLIQALSNKKYDDTIRGLALSILGEMKVQKIFRYLITSLQDKTFTNKLGILDALGSLNNPKAIPHLMQFISEYQTDNFQAKIYRRDYLQEQFYQLALDRFREKIYHSTFVVAKTIKILGAVGTADSIDLLLPWLSVSDTTIRPALTPALVKLVTRHPETYPKIVQQLQSPNEKIRQFTIRVLEDLEFNQEEIKKILKKMTHDPSRWVSEEAEKALKEIQKRDSY